MIIDYLTTYYVESVDYLLRRPDELATFEGKRRIEVGSNGHFLVSEEAGKDGLIGCTFIPTERIASVGFRAKKPKAKR